MEENCTDQMFKTVTVPTKYRLEPNQSQCKVWILQTDPLLIIFIQAAAKCPISKDLSPRTWKQPLRRVQKATWCGGDSPTGLLRRRQLLTRDRVEWAEFQRESLGIRLVTDNMQTQKREGANKLGEPV